MNARYARGTGSEDFTWAAFSADHMDHPADWEPLGTTNRRNAHVYTSHDQCRQSGKRNAGLLLLSAARDLYGRRHGLQHQPVLPEPGELFRDRIDPDIPGQPAILCRHPAEIGRTAIRERGGK